MLCREAKKNKTSKAKQSKATPECLRFPCPTIPLYAPFPNRPGQTKERKKVSNLTDKCGVYLETKGVELEKRRKKLRRKRRKTEEKKRNQEVSSSTKTEIYPQVLSSCTLFHSPSYPDQPKKEKRERKRLAPKKRDRAANERNPTASALSRRRLRNKGGEQIIPPLRHEISGVSHPAVQPTGYVTGLGSAAPICEPIRQ